MAAVKGGNADRYIRQVALIPSLAIAATQCLGLGIAASSSRAWVVAHLDRLGVTDQFGAIVTADNVERVKPAPDLYLAAVAALGVRPDEAIALEDAPNGVLSAQRAGVFVVAVPNPLTGQLPLDHADLRLTSLADMPLEALIEVVSGAYPVAPSQLKPR